MAMETMITSHENGIKKLQELTKDIRFCMLTTVDESGVLHSRPMTIQHTEPNGDLWFFTGKNTGMAIGVRHNDCVSAAFANDCGDIFVSVYGRARLLVDHQIMEKLWEPIYQTWFPQGLEDPNLSLLKLEVELAEHWDSAKGVLSTLFCQSRMEPASGAFLATDEQGDTAMKA